jgi:hypothetical protein
LLFGAIYYACVWQIDWALVTLPGNQQVAMTAHPDDAAILWYGWLAHGADQHPAGSAGAAADCRSAME